MQMTDIQPPHVSERTSAAPSAPRVARAVDAAVPPAIAGGRRIRLGYWLAAIVAGLALWAFIFTVLL